MKLSSLENHFVYLSSMSNVSTDRPTVEIKLTLIKLVEWLHGSRIITKLFSNVIKLTR